MQVGTALNRWLVTLVGGAFLSLQIVAPSAQAAMLSTSAVVEQEQLELQRDELQQFLARADVRDRLIAWGVDPHAARQRVDSLNAREIELMAQRMDELPAGGNVLGAAVFVFLVLLVTDILGFTDLFPFVRGPAD